MNKTDEAKVTTDTIICEFFEKHKAEASKLPNCTSILSSIKANGQQIFAYKAQLNAMGNIASQQKGNTHQVLVDKTLALLRRFGAYMALNPNSPLETVISFTATEVTKAKDSKLVDYATTLLNKGREMVAQLADVGITESGLDEFSDIIDLFQANIPRPKLEESSETLINKEISRLVKENVGYRAKIDAIMEIARETNKAFYESYRSLLRISKPIPNHIALAINVEDSQTAEPISGVTIALTLQRRDSTTKPLQRKSATKGGIRIKNLVEGTYTLTASKLGYRDQTLTINVISGEFTTLTIKLDKA